MWQACLLLNLFFSPPQTVAYSCCWRVSPVRALWSSWGWGRPAPPVSMLSARPSVTPAPCAAQPCRRCLWRSSAATPTATGCCSGRAASPLNAWSFVWSAARSAIAVRSTLRNSEIYRPLVVQPNAKKLWNRIPKWYILGRNLNTAASVKTFFRCLTTLVSEDSIPWFVSPRALMQRPVKHFCYMCICSICVLNRKRILYYISQPRSNQFQ